ICEKDARLREQHQRPEPVHVAGNVREVARSEVIELLSSVGFPPELAVEPGQDVAHEPEDRIVPREPLEIGYHVAEAPALSTELGDVARIGGRGTRVLRPEPELERLAGEPLGGLVPAG